MSTNKFVARNGIVALSDSTITGSLNVTNGITGSFSGTATSASFSTTAATASYADTFTVAGTLTAQKLVVQTITSSIVYSSGSNIFGNSLSNTQQFTGSLQVSGSTHYLFGNVGIGTTSPSALLNTFSATTATQIIVTGADTTNQRLEVTDGTVTNRFGIFGRTNGDAGTIGTQTNHPLVFNTNSVERMRITSSGNVEVRSAGKLIAYRSDNTRFGEFFTDNLAVHLTSSNDPIRISSADRTEFYNAGSERMRITSGGDLQLTSGVATFNRSGKKIELNANVSNLNVDAEIEITSGMNLFFKLGGSERMRITSGGNVGIGTATPKNIIDIVGLGGFSRNSNDLAYSHNLYFLSGDWKRSSTSAGSSIYQTTGIVIFYSAAAGGSIDGAVTPTETARIGTNGDFTITGSNATKASGTAWINPSDLRLKTNIRPYNKGLAEVLKIHPKLWNFNQDSGFDQTKEHLSVIAQEIQDFMPEMVSTYKGKLNGKETELLRVDASDITWLLVKAIQELKAEIEILKNN